MNKIKSFPLIILLKLFFLLLFGSCSHLERSPSQARELINANFDTVVEQLQLVYTSEVSSARKAEVKVFQENLLKYLIEATSSDEAYKLQLYREANVYFNKIYPLLISNIKNEKAGGKDFYEIKKAPLWTLKEELKFLNAEARKTPKLMFNVDLIDGLKAIAPLYKNLGDAEKNQLSDLYKILVNRTMGDDFNKGPDFSELDALIRTEGKDDERILNFIGMVELKVKNQERRIRNIGTEIIKSGQVDMKNAQVRMVTKFMDYYFGKLPNDVVKTIMSELVSGGVKLTEEEVMKVIFQNSGPGLGKLLQQVGKESGIGEQFSALISLLESSGKEVPLHLVEEVIKADKGGFEIKSIEGKSVGTGTIAQVNRAKMWYDDKEVDVALRFLKPGVAKRCKEDIAILRQFVPDNEELLKKEGFQDLKIISTLINSVEKFLDEEVDINAAVEKQKRAVELYNRSVKIAANEKFDMLEIKVPEVYSAPRGKSNLHIQEFASGGLKFAKLTDDDTKKIVAKEMVRMWFEEALFQSGFLNADLHQGNFRIVLVEENNKIKVLLYDFGLSSTLSKEEQRAFLLLGAGAYMKSPKVITDGLMVSMDSSDKKLRAKLLSDIQEEMKRSPLKRPEDWVVWCVQKNYFVSDNLGAFARGSLLLKQLPESLGDTQMFKDTIVKSALTNLRKAIADRDYNYPLTKIDLIKLAVEQTKSFCRDIFKSFFKK